MIQRCDASPARSTSTLSRMSDAITSALFVLTTSGILPLATSPK